MYNLKKVRGKVVHKIIQEIVHNSIVSQKPMKLFIIYIRNLWSRYTSYGIINCNEKLAFSSEKRTPSTEMYGHKK